MLYFGHCRRCKHRRILNDFDLCVACDMARFEAVGVDPPPRKPLIRIRPLFAWYDMWIGVFIDTAKRRAYVLPLPCIGFVIEF